MKFNDRKTHIRYERNLIMKVFLSPKTYELQNSSIGAKIVVISNLGNLGNLGRHCKFIIYVLYT